MDWVTDTLIDTIVTWCADMIVGALDVLWNLLAATAFVSPDVPVLPQVQALSRTSLAIVNTVYVLAMLWMAVLVMGRDTIQARYGPGELIPRLLIGLIGANFAMPLCSQLIELANALTAALTAQDITAAGSMQQIRTAVTGSLVGQPGRGPTGLLLIVIGLVIAILVGALMVQWIVRLGVLIIAVGLAPIALAMHGTPQTEPAAKLWWRTMLGALGIVIIQAVALHTTLAIFVSPQANLVALGLPGDAGEVMNLLIVLCMLWAIQRIPTMMRRYITRSAPSPAGTFLRVVLVQQLTRGLNRVVGRGGAARRGAGRGAPSGRSTDLPWPTGTPRGSGSPALPRPAASRRPVPAAGAGPGVVGIAYPTGRPVTPYTRDELDRGVDLYTRSLKNRRQAPPSGGNRP